MFENFSNNVHYHVQKKKTTLYIYCLLHYQKIWIIVIFPIIFLNHSITQQHSTPVFEYTPRCETEQHKLIAEIKLVKLWNLNSDMSRLTQCAVISSLSVILRRVYCFIST